MKRLVITTVIGSMLLATASFPQGDKEGKIQQRNGSLTAGETSKLEHQESKVNKEVRTDRKANGGNLTNNEKAQVNEQQNKMSKEIYNDKHNAAKQSQ